MSVLKTKTSGGFAVFKVDLESLKQAATSTWLMANPANSANRLTPEAESGSQLATLATLAVSHGSHSAANDAWAAVAVADLLAAAMRCCDKHGDGPEAREEMKRQCLEIPAHLRGDLLDYFKSHYPE